MPTLTITTDDGDTTTYSGTGAGIRAEILMELANTREDAFTDAQRRVAESSVQAAVDWDDTVRDYLLSVPTLEDLGHFLGGPDSIVTITD